MSNATTYAANARKSKILELAARLDTKHNTKNTLIEFGKDTLVGVLGGGLAGAAIGKSSLLWGALASLIGHYEGVPILATAGIGMMASGGYQVGQSIISGVGEVDGIEEAKNRMKSFISNLKERLYLDKLIKPKTSTSAATNGLGNVQYFKYPNQGQDLDVGSLQSIEEQLSRSARQYQAQMAGPDEQILGPDDQILGADDDRLY